MADKVTLVAPDISCEHCVMSITEAVTALDGVKKVKGDPSKKTVVVEYDAKKTRVTAIEEAMAAAGYPVQK